MRKNNILSIIFILVFMVSCLTFFSAEATDTETPSESVSATAEIVTTDAPTESQSVSVVETTLATEVTTPAPTTAATAADPVYTSSTKKEETTTSTSAVQTDAYETKETKEIQTTEKITEPTSVAKNIVNYGSKYRPIKWLSLVVMIASIAGLIAVNVNYKNKHGNGKKGTSKPKLDTSARFTPPVVKEEEVKSEPIDLSSFSRKSEKSQDDDVFGESKRDDDLYI